MPVYFIRAGSDGPVKIGYGRSAEARRATLQVGNHERLTIIRVIEGGSIIERQMHIRFAAARRSGEWFDFHPDMLTVDPASLPKAKRLNRSPSAKAATVGEAVAICFRAFGGTHALARRLKVPVSTAHSWRRKDQIPAWRMREIEVAAAEDGVDLVAPAPAQQAAA